MTDAEKLRLLEAEAEMLDLEAEAASAAPAPETAPEPQPEPEQPGLLSRAAGAIAKGAGDVAEMPVRTWAEDVPAMLSGKGDPTGEGPGGARLLKRGLAAASGFADMGTFGHRDEASAAFETARQAAEPPTKEQVLGRAGKPQPGLLDLYYANRAASGRENRALQEQEPGGAIAGDLAALAPGLGASAARAAPTWGARLLQSLKAAVPQGAAFGAGTSEAKPLKGDVGDYLKDTALGGAIAAGTAGLTTAAGEVAAPLARRAKDFAIDQGRRFLTSGADQLSTRAPVAAAAVEEALASRAIPVGGTVDTARGRLDALVTEQDALRRSIIDELAARGVRGPRAQSVADELMSRAAALRPNTMNRALPAEYETQAAELMGKVGGNPRRTLSLPQAESLKSDLQRTAKYGRVEETPVNEIRRDVASALRQANEDAVAAAAARAPVGSDTANLGAQFVPVKQRESRLLEALKASERGTARAAQRQGGGIASGAVGAAESAQLMAQAAQGNAMPGWLGYLKKLAGGGRMKSAEARGAYALANALESRQPDFLSRYAPALSRVEIGGLAGNEDPEALKQRALIEALRGGR